jgi:hypothetical protein
MKSLDLRSGPGLSDGLSSRTDATSAVASSAASAATAAAGGFVARRCGLGAYMLADQSIESGIH